MINRTPHFGVWSALAHALNFGGVWITAPALHLLLQKQNFVNFVKKNSEKIFLQIFLLLTGQKNCVVNCAGVDFFEF